MFLIRDWVWHVSDAADEKKTAEWCRDHTYVMTLVLCVEFDLSFNVTFCVCIKRFVFFS